MTDTRDPVTPDDWYRAVLMAEALLHLDSARQYGLITGGPGIHVDRCLAIRAAGRRRGVVITDEELGLAIGVLVAANWRRRMGVPHVE